VKRYGLRFALTCLSVVGCTSAPVRYYTLAPPPDQAVPVSEPTFAIVVRVVHIPPQLNRSELMVRTGPTEMTLLENERWVSPVDDEIKDALSLALQRRLTRPPLPRAASTAISLDIDVQRLEAQLGQRARLEASWSAISAAGGQTTGVRAAACKFQADEKIRAGYAEMVQGYQRDIAALADAILTGLARAVSGSDGSCRQANDDAAGGSG
jgi:hypothetical protein